MKMTEYTEVIHSKVSKEAYKCLNLMQQKLNKPKQELLDDAIREFYADRMLKHHSKIERNLLINR